MTEPQPHHSAEKPLQSWKEIAAYLERDVRTVGRWAKENGLPVRRHGTGKGSSVYAFPSEIAAWSAVGGGGTLRSCSWRLKPVAGPVILGLGLPKPAPVKLGDVPARSEATKSTFAATVVRETFGEVRVLRGRTGARPSCLLCAFGRRRLRCLFC